MFGNVCGVWPEGPPADALVHARSVEIRFRGHRAGQRVDEFVVINNPVFCTALIPVVTEVGIAIVGLVKGGTVIEIGFAWPGIARLAFQAAQDRDYPMLQGCVMTVRFSSRWSI